MRTTLTIDDDVARQLERRMHERGATFKETVNDVLRRGLRPSAEKLEYRVAPFCSAVLPGIDLRRALALAAGMDDEERPSVSSKPGLSWINPIDPGKKSVER